MITIVGIRFKKAGKIYYFEPGDEHLTVGDGAIVETARGLEFGDVVIAPREVDPETVVQPLKSVIRKATPKDYKQVEKNKQREERAFQIGLEKIANRGLPMKLINVPLKLRGRWPLNLLPMGVRAFSWDLLGRVRN